MESAIVLMTLFHSLQLFLLASFCGFLTALHNLVYAFIGASPEHWCELPDLPNLTTDQLKDRFIPMYVHKMTFMNCSFNFSIFNAEVNP